MHVEGVTRQAYCDRIVRRDVNRGHAGRADPLHDHLLGVDRQVLVLGLAEHIVADVVIRLLKVRAIHQRDIPEIVLKTIIGHQWRSHFKAGYDHQNDRQKSTERFKSSHRSELRRQARGANSGLGRQHSLKIFNYRRDPNIAYFPSRAKNDFHSIFGNLLSDRDSKGDTD